MASRFIPLSLTLFCLFPFFSNAADPLHLTLTRRAGNHDMSWYASHADHIRAKYSYPTAKSSRRRTVAGVSLTNQDLDASYFATVSIGSPPQQFNLILDTGSSDLWVADSNCLTCSRSTPVFDPSKSTSLNLTPQQTTIKYGSGAVQGQLGSDTVTMADFTITNQTFLAVTQLTSGLLDGSVSGIMGLAFQAIASTNAVPFWQQLSNDGKLDNPEMSFWITRVRNDPNAQAEEPGGVFTLGGTNSSLFTGNVEFLNMPSQPSFWLLAMSAITVQGKKVSISTGNAALSAIDTGTTLIGGPSADVQAIYAAIPGSQPLDNMAGFFSFPCKTSVQVTLSFGGSAWPINSDDMNLGQVTQGSPQCVGGIFDLSLGSNIGAGSGNPSWVVGDTFLKNVYSVFRANPPSVGFAQLSSLAGGSGAAPSSQPASSSNVLTTPPSVTPSLSPPVSVPATLTGFTASNLPSPSVSLLPLPDSSGAPSSSSSSGSSGLNGSNSNAASSTPILRSSSLVLSLASFIAAKYLL